MSTFIKDNYPQVLSKILQNELYKYAEVEMGLRIPSPFEETQQINRLLDNDEEDDDGIV